MHTNPRLKAIEIAREIVALNPIYLDTETTGVDQAAEIVEICIVDEHAQTLMNTLVKPKAHIPQDAIRIHGITNSLVQNAPSWLTIWPKVQKIITGQLVAVYNADFDKKMLQQSNKAHNIPWSAPPGTRFFCIMRLYAQFYGDWNSSFQNYRWHSLEKAGLQSNIKFMNSHRACADTQLARDVLHYICNQDH